MDKKIPERNFVPQDKVYTLSYGKENPAGGELQIGARFTKELIGVINTCMAGDGNDGMRVLFVCTHNSVRSQMAQGLLNYFYGDRYTAYSAGTKPSRVNSYAVKVMSEIGIDISKNQSKGIGEFTGMEFDYVVTVCDRAKEVCPFFAGGKKHMHKGFKDPGGLRRKGDDPLVAFRQIRDEIEWWIEETFGEK